MALGRLVDLFRASWGRNGQPEDRLVKKHRRGGGGPNKSWQQDRQCCLLILQRAVDLFQLVTLGVAKMPTFKELSSDVVRHHHHVKLERSATLEEDESPPTSGDRGKHRCPRRVPLAVLFMIAITVCTITSAVLVERKMGFEEINSPVIDFVVPILCTTASFMVIIQCWKKHRSFVRIVTQVYDNLVELPAVYCADAGDLTPEISTITTSVSSSTTSGTLGTITTTRNGRGSRVFTMAPLKRRAWAQTMQKHHQFAALMFLYTLLTSIHIFIGASKAIYYTRIVNNTDVEDSRLDYQLIITAGYSLQAFFTVVYPLTNYAYVCLCVVLTVQSEHLNQFIRGLKTRCGDNGLPLKEELQLMRVWFSRVARSTLAFDRFSHLIFFFLWAAQIGAMSLKSMQVHEIFEKGAFTFGNYVHFFELGLLCFGTILNMQIVYSLNKSICKPSHYIVELGAHGAVVEPAYFTEYLAHISPRFGAHKYQLTMLRIMPIGKEFFMITSFFIISAVASYGAFGKIISDVNHQFHLLI